MVDLIEIKKGNLTASTQVIAIGVNLEHRAIMQMVDKYSEDFKEFGTLAFEMRKSAGRPVRISWLNEDQSVFLITLLRNSKIVVEFKKRLTKEFGRMKKTLNQIAANQKNAEWLEKRNLGKRSRLIETDEIKRFVEYAEKNGSKNAKRYYGLITKAENKALFFLEQKFKNVRNVLQGHQLETMSNADRIVSKQLKKCVDENIDYHKGYYMAKDAVETFAGLIGKTLVPMLDQKQID